MNYTKNMWDTWKDWRLDEESEDLTKLFEEFQKVGVDEKFTAHTLPFSNKEAQHHVESDIKEMGQIFNKSSQRAIAIMLSGVKNKKYDAMDLIRGLSTGKIQTSHGVGDMLKVLWSKVEKRFRKYLRGKKRS
jgi:hypothetical protein